MDQSWLVRLVHVQCQCPGVDVAIHVSTGKNAATIANAATGQVTDGAHMLSGSKLVLKVIMAIEKLNNLYLSTIWQLYPESSKPMLNKII